MWFAFGMLAIIVALGLSLAVANLRDEEAREERLRQRREQRKNRKRLW